MRIDEVYLSIQGEGPRVGIPTVFVRTGGCNLRCPGWPCDTLHAVLPEYRGNWERMEPHDVGLRASIAAMGVEEWNVCLTGGEPFLQKSDELHELVLWLKSQPDVDTVECFSNGTLQYPDWATNGPQKVTFIMDWKLPGSGEDPYNEMRLQNLRNLTDEDAVKFVIKDEEDYRVAKVMYYTYIDGQSPVEVYYGVAWDLITPATLVGWVLKDGLPWRLNLQTHNMIWDRRKRGI